MLLSSSVDRAGGAPILTGGMPSLFASSKPNCRARSLAHSVALTHISRIIDGSLVASPRCRVCSANTDFIAFSRFRCIILLKLIEEYASKPRRQCAWVSKRDRSKFTFFKALTISFLSFLNTLRSSLYATSRDVSSTPRYIEIRQEGFTRKRIDEKRERHVHKSSQQGHQAATTYRVPRRQYFINFSWVRVRR